MVALQLESLPSMVAGVWSNDNNMQLEATTQFRKLLSIGMTNPAPASVLLILFNFPFNLHANFDQQKEVLLSRKLFNLVLFLVLLSF